MFSTKISSVFGHVIIRYKTEHPNKLPDLKKLLVINVNIILVS